jgi:uncharacterized protein
MENIYSVMGLDIYFTVDAMINALIGGAMMGVSATIMLLFNGRIMGVCGIAHGIFYFQKENMMWRILFIVGMFIGGYLMTLQGVTETVSAITTTAIDAFERGEPVNTIGIPLFGIPLFLIAGFLTGLGTSLGNGCTTGHGVCGLSRLSLRGMMATMMFMFSAGVTVFIVRHIHAPATGA